tara:strand:+ start:1326 stop:2543 length:1218 start_codon:yes stop_codon:yes gene_type:complete
MKKNELGLPLEIEYCKKCNLINQRPTSINEYFHLPNSKQTTVEFTDGVCSACNFVDIELNKINWKLREKELKNLCDKYRKNNGEYDCVVPGSGGKDSVFASYILKYKYKMKPLTVTWTPNLYTEIGWNNFQKWLHKGGFDNYLYTPNPVIMRKLTRESTKNLLHPFQPFILGQKTFALKMASLFNIKLIFYGEVSGKGGKKISHNVKSFSDIKDQQGFEMDPLNGKKFSDVFIGGKKVEEYLDEGLSMNDLKSYKPLEIEKIKNEKMDFYYLGYFLKWIPQEMYYFSQEKIDFEANDVRTEGTYTKFCSLDDKIDGFHFYTFYIKYGHGRAMSDAVSDTRHGHITREEGKSLIKKYDGEYPIRHEKAFLDYISMDKVELINLCNKFRPKHLWDKISGKWVLKKKL